jgi:hypothetical protein
MTVTNNLLSNVYNYESSTLIVCVQKIGEEYKTRYIPSCVTCYLCWGMCFRKTSYLILSPQEEVLYLISLDISLKLSYFHIWHTPCISLHYSHSVHMNVGSDIHKKTICSDKCFELVGTRPQKAAGETAVGRNRNSWVPSSPPWALFAWLQYRCIKSFECCESSVVCSWNVSCVCWWLV